jgi:hypothetical protein
MEDGFEVTSTIFQRHPFAILLFLLSGISTLCLCPIFSAYESQIHSQYPWTVNISLIEFGCIAGFLYIASFLYCVISYIRRK